jgi:hypothetical protein
LSRNRGHSVRFSSARRRALYVIGVGVWLSGGLWLLFHYFLTKQGEFGPQSNPLEPWWLKIHGAFAFAATWLFGLLWGTHITVGWRSGRRRASGGVLTGLIFWLVLSGYLLYYAGDDRARSLISIGHWGLGLACPLLYWIHRMRKRASARSVRDREQTILEASAPERGSRVPR